MVDASETQVPVSGQLPEEEKEPVKQTAENALLDSIVKKGSNSVSELAPDWAD